MTRGAEPLYVPDRSLPARIQRRLTQWQTAAPLQRTHHRPVITFTFDDFPKSAASDGAAILEDAGARATYYVASGLGGRTLVIGDMFEPEDVLRLQSAGHEIGSHTHSHRDCTRMAIADCLADIERGDRELLAMGHAAPLRQFAYPFGETTPALKRHIARRYDCARGILPGINRKANDRAQLRAVELGDDSARMTRAFAAIQTVVNTPGWLIFFTHDVREAPSPYGVSPGNFRRVVQAARDSGARILTMGRAFDAFRDPPG